MLRRAVLAGMGLAVLPTFMVAGDLAAGRLRTVVESFQGTKLTIFAVYAPSPHSSRAALSERIPSKVRAFVSVLTAAFRNPPWAVP